MLSAGCRLPLCGCCAALDLKRWWRRADLVAGGYTNAYRVRPLGVSNGYI